MYLIEWEFWQMITESETKRKASKAEMTSSEIRMTNEFYAEDLEEEFNFQPASEKPQTRGPVYAFNENFMEMRCGGSEEKRGLLTLAVLGGIIPVIGVTTISAVSFLWIDITDHATRSFITVTLTLIMTLIAATAIYLYAKHGIKLTRLEMLTSRHLLIRFNRIHSRSTSIDQAIAAAS